MLNKSKNIDKENFKKYSNLSNKNESSILQTDMLNKQTLHSVHGRRCLTKCYPKGTVYLHPTILTGYKDKLYDTCAIDPVYSKEEIAEKQSTYEKEVGLIFIDKCNLDDNKIYEPPNELESILLSFYFNPTDFLNNIYNLHSFDQVIYWTLENDYLPFDTIKRVHNCAWKAFGSRLEEISNVVYEYYYEIAKDHWLWDYVKLIENNYSFNLVSSEDNGPISTTDDTKQETATNEIYKIILNKYFDYDFFVSSIKRYVYEYQDQWNLIESHYGMIKKFVFKQLVRRIES